MKRILCLKFPGWPLQRLVASKPELRQTLATRGIVIHTTDPRRGDVVRLCSAHAWMCGVRPGMPLAEATVLFRSPDEVAFAEHNPTADLKLLAKIAAWCERYSPLVGWETVAAGRREVAATLPGSTEPEALFLDITSIGVLFGGEQKLAEDLLAELSRRGFVAHVGVADTIGAAWAVAARSVNENFPGEDKHWQANGTQADSVSRLPLACQCSVLPCTIIPRDGTQAALASLPITTLRLSPDNVATLHELGVKTISELLALPRRGLSSRFGPGLLLRLDQALGDANELIQPDRPPPAFKAEWLLEHPTQRREELEIIVAQLVERVAGQLSQRQAGAVQLACRLDAAGQKPATFTVGLYRPTASLKHLLELVQMQLERLRLTGPIGRVGLSVLLTSPLETYQAKLFDDVSLRSERARALLLDRLSSRLGAEAVLRPLLRPDALPERAVQFIEATGREGKRAKGKGQRITSKGKTAEGKGRKGKKSDSFALCSLPSALLTSLPSHRPLRLLSPPLEVQTTALAPDGPPIRLWYGKQEYRVARHWGPERIETAWWRGRAIRRDYYRVETTSGQRFWLFRELRQGGWFLHGVFE